MKRILGELPKEEVSHCLGRKVFQIGRAGQVTEHPPNCVESQGVDKGLLHPRLQKASN